MRRIQTKLNTPTNSVEDLHTKPQKTVKKAPIQKPQTTEPPQTAQPLIPKQPYRPPSINLSTWSERPKTQVSLKEDTDYRIKNASEPPRNLTNYPNNNDIVNVRTHTETNNVSIKINGADPIIPQPTGNVIIKIGTSAQTTETTFRKPLGKSRPHSIAFDSNFDVSRVPIVRSVELKKNLVKDPQINKSVTQIYNTSNGDANLRETKFYNQFSDYRNVPDKFSDSRRSTEALNGFKPGVNKTANFSIPGETKPVVRVNSFAINAAPTVRGFRTSESNDLNAYRKSWTTPSKPNNESKTETTPSANHNVPFSQVTLRKSESGKNLLSTNNNNNPNKTPFGNVVLRNTSSQNVINNNYRNSIAAFPEKKEVPSPPIMPKITSFTKKPQKSSPVESDSRGQLLSDIRNFGGKKGLKSVKY